MIKSTIRMLEFLAPVSDLALRLWVANVFFKSGMNKFESMDITRMLFENEYAVPFLPPDIAANLATGVELIFPTLLAIGLAGRFSAGVLFVFNIIAVVSYPSLNPAGVQQHIMWGIMLLVPFLHGPGKLSIDHLIRKRYMGTD
ncbi:MAG: membrane protein [marine bacterium B5-7]|nr:MAG: membrane protein [marine bacterium B5-7]